MDKDDILIIHVPNTKNNKQRTFTVCNSKENLIDVVSICKKYFNLRPKNLNSRRLFIKYYNGKCSTQNVGHHTIGAIPSKIAIYLNLPNTQNYTGHCYRRTSATLLADTGADILTLKRHGGWKSTSVAEGYVEDSIQNKISVAKKILDTNVSVTRLETESFAAPCIYPLDENSIKEVPIIQKVAAETTNNTCVQHNGETFKLSNLSEQISFSNCSIYNPIFNITLNK